MSRPCSHRVPAASPLPRLTASRLSTSPPILQTPSPLRLLPLLAVGAFASQASIRLADPMLPQLAAEFGTGAASLSGVITAFAVAYGLMQLFFGPMADRFGKLRIIAGAACAAAAGSAACALAGGPASLTALRLLTGAACAGLIPLTIAWIGDNVPYEARQTVLARFMVGTTLGNVFGQVAGGVFSDTVGWRMTFLLPALLFAVVALLLGWRLHTGQAASPPAAGAGSSGNPIAAFGQVLRSPQFWKLWVLYFIGSGAGLMVIGNVAGMAKASVYKHFASKEDLAGAAMVRALDRALAFVDDLREQGLSSLLQQDFSP